VPSRSPRSYTPKHLADRILASRAALEGERKNVTVLFADLKGSMELAEQVGPERWHAILDRFFQILSEGIHRFEGTVNQYTGDGIMALFGAPLAHEDHAQRACFAALHLQEALRAYADELRRIDGVSISTRIGINSGDVVVGRIGDDLRMDYTAQGHTVGLAQRMEQRAAPDSTYLSDQTARLATGYFALKPLGPFQLKGVSEPVEVYELRGLGEMRTRLDRSRARGFSRFVGRADELGLLEAALDRCLEGRGGVVGVVGEAGVGKSRLCSEFIGHCRARNVAVFETHCPSHGRTIPLLPVLELLRGTFGIQPGDDVQTAREKIAGRMLLLERNLEEMLPLAFEFLGVSDEHDRSPEPDPAARQRQLIALVRRLTEARSAREPAVLFVDDVHWIDPVSDTFLEALADTVPGTRTLLLLNFRPEYAADWMTRSTYQQLPLQPLGDEAIEALLDHLLGGDESLRALRPLIRERSGGNPFFVEEIVHHLCEAGSLSGERGARTLSAPIDRIEVPATVQTILAARIDRLPERDKRLLQTAAAIGLRFPEPLLTSVSQTHDEEVSASLRALVHAELIHEEALYPEAVFAFRHPLTHEVARSTQLAEARRAIHAEIAKALEIRHSQQLDENAALLAHHWDEAAAPAPAALWHRRAAEWIGGSNAREASRHWRRVRELADVIPDAGLANELGERSRLMLLEYGWRLGMSDGEADALVAEGEDWARRRGDDHALAALYNAFSMQCVLSMGQTARARRCVEEGLRAVRNTDDRVLAFALELRANLLADYTGDVAEMEASAERLRRFSPEEMEAATPLLGYSGIAFTETAFGQLAKVRGDFSGALAHFRRAAELARERHDTEVLGWALSFQSDALLLADDVRGALRIAQEALDLAERLESPLSVAFASVQLAGALLESGDVEAALATAQRAIECAARAARTVEPDALAIVARCRLARGEADLARRSADDAVRLAETMELGPNLLVTLLARARIHLALDPPEPDAAAADLSRARHLVEERGLVFLRPDLLELSALLEASAAG
jgi:class 3 adenylate cyclase/tetratricopeptide (TPR) repeat protein